MDKDNEPSPSSSAPQKPSLKLALYGGAGIGLLFGIIMGTSTTPTVATVLGALTTMLAAILGLNDKYFNNAKAVRLGSFGFACVIGAYTGLFVRSHNLLSPSPEALKSQYLRLGHSEEQALKLVTFKEFGFFQLPNTSNNGPSAVQDSPQSDATSAAPTAQAPPFISQQVTQQHSSLLFGAEVDLSGCEELADTDTTLPLEEILNNFELTGGVWETLVSSVIDNVDALYQSELLFATRDAVCAETNQNTLQTGCDEFNHPDTSVVQTTLSFDNLAKLNYQTLLSLYSSKPGVWSDIASRIDQLTWPKRQKSIALISVKESFCDSGETL